MPSSLRLERVSKTYQKGDRPVLRPLDLEVKKGELFFLLGPSGCGKTTLLRIIAGLLKPDAGRIFFDEREVTNLPPEKRNAAMVFQNYSLWPHMNVFENVAFGLRVRGIKDSETRARVAEALDFVGMSEFAKKKVTQLSGGQQQRIVLARAFVVNPDVLLLDEPLSNLDARLRDHLRVEIKRICRERGLTAVYVTHDLREAMGIGDRIALLEGGAVNRQGPPLELCRDPKTRFAASFLLGTVNFVKASLISLDADGRALLSTPLGKLEAAKPAPEIIRKKEFTIMIAARHLTPVSGQDVKNSFQAVYSNGILLSDHSESQYAAPDGSALEVVEEPCSRSKGENVMLAVRPENIIFLED